MSRKMVFFSVALVWVGAAVVFNSPSYIHMVTGAGCALFINWVTQ